MLKKTENLLKLTLFSRLFFRLMATKFLVGRQSIFKRFLNPF